MSGDETESGFFDGINRLPENTEPLHALHRPYKPDRDEEDEE